MKTVTFDETKWRLVPIEATEKQLDYAVSFALNVSISANYKWTQYMSDVWSRMIAAAPEHKEE